MARAPGEPALATAAATSLALALTLAFVPGAPWLAPLALLGGLWAPGYALVRLAYVPGRLSGVERHALSAAAGLLLLPLVVVGLSLPRAFTASGTAWALALLTLACALAARRWRPAEGEEFPARAALPGTRATLALALAALALAALVLVPTLLRAAPAPAALALTGPDGGPAPLEADVGGNLTVHVVAIAGDAPQRGRVVVSWDGDVVLRRTLNLPAGANATIPLALPVGRAGPHPLEARWEGPGREVHALVQAVGA